MDVGQKSTSNSVPLCYGQGHLHPIQLHVDAEKV